MTHTYTRIFLVFETENSAAAARRLGEGLKFLHHRLPYLGGNVSTDDDAGKQPKHQQTIRWCEPYDEDVGGAKYTDIRPPAVARWREIRPVTALPSIQQLKDTDAPLHHFTNELSPLGVMVPYSDGPVFAASYTRLDGGLVVCFCVHHLVMDGGGTAELAAMWARLCCDGNAELEADPKEPLTRLERLLHATEIGAGKSQAWVRDMSLDDLMARHPEYRLASQSRAPAWPTPPSDLPASTSEIISFSTAKLAEARDALQEHLSVPSELSINSVLSSIIWSCVTRVRLQRQNEWDAAAGGQRSDFKAKLGFAVNARRKLGDGFLGSKYLGNVNLYGLAPVDLGTLTGASLFDHYQMSAASERKAICTVIDAIAAAVNRIDNRHIGEVLALVDKLPDMEDMLPGWNSFHSVDFAMTSWANQNFYEMDFGDMIGGKPLFVRVPHVQFDGLAITLPRRRNGSSERIEVVIFLNAKDLEALKADSVWNSWR